MIIAPEDDIEDFTDRGHVAQAWDRARRLWCSRLPYSTHAVIMVGLPGAGKSTWARTEGDGAGVLIFDGCFTRGSARAQAVRPALTAGIPVTFVWVSTDVEVCIARDRARRRIVGASAIRTMASSATPPRASRGVRVVVVGPGDPPPSAAKFFQ